MSSKTQTQNHFSVVPDAEIQSSSFDRSCGLKTTFNTGELIPIFLDEVLPGDNFDLKTTTFGRLSTPIFPFMDNLYLDVHYFFVPNRLTWDNWERFNGAQDNPGDSTDFTIPKMQATPTTGYSSLSLFDYFGLPTKVPNYPHSSLPLRGYNLIYNEWYRDENLQTRATVNKGNSADPATDYIIRKRGNRKDYFMSCLPWPQKGPAVLLPLGTSAPVQTNGTDGTLMSIKAPNIGATNYLMGTNGTYLNINNTSAADTNQLYANLTQATAVTINQMRLAFQIQRVYERDARGGTRYVEFIKAHFNVTVPDFRLQRPEFLGSHTQQVTSTPVAQTAPTDSTSPQGNLSAYSVTSGSGGFSHSFPEHGYVIGIASLRGDQSYQQGLERHWSRSTRFDYYLPALSHLGEQATLNQEIYCQDPAVMIGSTPANLTAFGYNERNAEYRYKPNIVTGAFRSNYTATLDPWHLAYKFDALPVLNSDLISRPVPTKRMLAVLTEPDLILDCHFKYTCKRPMPTYAVPGLIDHF